MNRVTQKKRMTNHLGKERRKIDWMDTFKYTTCTLPLSLIVWKSTEMDAKKFVCKKCSFTTKKLKKLNTHAKKIHVVHNVGKAPDEKPRTTPRSEFHTRETFDEIIDELESRDPPVDIRIVISAIITKPSETKRRKKQTAQTFVRVHDIGCDGSFILDNGHFCRTFNVEIVWIVLNKNVVKRIKIAFVFFEN